MVIVRIFGFSLWPTFIHWIECVCVHDATIFTNFCFIWDFSIRAFEFISLCHSGIYSRARGHIFQFKYHAYEEENGFGNENKSIGEIENIFNQHCHIASYRMMIAKRYGENGMTEKLGIEDESHYMLWWCWGRINRYISFRQPNDILSYQP